MQTHLSLAWSNIMAWINVHSGSKYTIVLFMLQYGDLSEQSSMCRWSHWNFVFTPSHLQNVHNQKMNTGLCRILATLYRPQSSVTSLHWRNGALHIRKALSSELYYSVARIPQNPAYLISCNNTTTMGSHHMSVINALFNKKRIKGPRHTCTKQNVLTNFLTY